MQFIQLNKECPMAKSSQKPQEVTGWVGWVYFAGIMMVILGVLQMIAGFTALFNDEWFLVTENVLLTFDFTTWGWIHVLLGVAIAASGVAVTAGSVLGRSVAVLLAALNIIALFGFVSAYPVWVIILITINVLVIYALVVHGGEAKLEE